MPTVLDLGAGGMRSKVIYYYRCKKKVREGDGGSEEEHKNAKVSLNYVGFKSIF